MSTNIFRPLHFVSTARKMSDLTGKTIWPETAESSHCREKSGASRPWQFFADSGQDQKVSAEGRILVFQLFIVFCRRSLSSHRRAPVHHRADYGGGSENRASVAPFPLSPLSRFPRPPVIECAFAHGALAPDPVRRAATAGRRTAVLKFLKNEN